MRLTNIGKNTNCTLNNFGNSLLSTASLQQKDQTTQKHKLIESKSITVKCIFARAIHDCDEDLKPSGHPELEKLIEFVEGPRDEKTTEAKLSNVEDVRWLEEPPKSSALVFQFYIYFSLMGPTFFREASLLCVRLTVCVRRDTITRKVLNLSTSGLLHMKDHI